MHYTAGILFLNNDKEVITELTNNPALQDFEVFTLGKVFSRDRLEASSSFEISHNKVMKYSYYVRLFHAWKYPQGSVSQEENLVLTGFIDMRKKIFIESIITEYQYNLSRA